MAIEIRNATRDEYTAIADAMSTAFLERPDVAAIGAQVQDLWEPDRTWVAIDGGRVCGTFRSWGTELTLPGLATLPAAAVAGVTVLPTHRRQGILTRLAAAEHAALVERGEALALLYAAEFPIYGRFGYGPATRYATWTVDFTRSRTTPRDADTGAFELVTPTEAIADEMSAFYDEWRRRQPGELKRRSWAWTARLGILPEAWGQPFKGFYALHRDPAGRLDGFIRYRNEESWEDNLPKNRLEVTDLFGSTDAVEAALWSFLASIDLVTAVKAPGRSPSDHVPWLLENPRAAVLSGTRRRDVGQDLRHPPRARRAHVRARGVPRPRGGGRPGARRRDPGPARRRARRRHLQRHRPGARPDAPGRRPRLRLPRRPRPA